MNRYLWEKRLRGSLTVLSPTEYIVLTMLALHTNKAGRGARPAMATLADECSVSRDTVKRSLRGLVSKGYVVLSERGGGRNRPSVYDLVWDMPHVQKTGQDDAPVSDGDVDDHETQETGHPDAPLSPQETGHPDAPVSTQKRGHAEPEKGAPGTVKGGTQVHPDQVRSGKKSGTYAPYSTTEACASDDERETHNRLPEPAPKLRPEHRRQKAIHERDEWCSSAAWQIVQQFAKSRSAIIPNDDRVEISRQVEAALHDNVAAEAIATGLVDWANSDRVYPSQIRRFITKAALRSQPDPGAGKPTSKALGHMTVAEQIIAEMESE